MTIEEIERLVRQAEASDQATSKHVVAGATLLLRKTAVSSAARGNYSTSASLGSGWHASATIAAPFAGTFLSRHPQRDDNLAAPGARIAKGAIVGLLKVGPCLRPVTTGEDCVIETQLAEDGALVGYGTPLFRLANRAQPHPTASGAPP